jgi:hypothetical protein
MHDVAAYSLTAIIGIMLGVALGLVVIDLGLAALLMTRVLKGGPS